MEHRPWFDPAKHRWSRIFGLESHKKLYFHHGLDRVRGWVRSADRIHASSSPV